MSFKEIFPPIENAIEMEPEELAIFVLRYLNTQTNINRHNFLLGSGSEFIDYAGKEKEREKFLEKLSMAWMWLEKELFIAPKPGEAGEWAFITPRGKKILENQNFDTYKKGNLLPSDNLDPILARKVKPSFIRGDYDTAVFQAFKEIEVRVRKKANLTNKDYGVSLMRKAFNPTDGILTDQEAEQSEKIAKMELFAGATGFYKNPSSHRDVNFSDPNEVADIIHTANQLLRILNSIK